MDDRVTRTEFSALADETRKAYEPKIANVCEDVDAPGVAPVMIVPPGMQVIDAKKYIDAARPLPERRKGTAHLCDLASFTAHVNRHKDENSVVFADPGNDGQGAKLEAVIDYNHAGPEATARWGQLRARYDFEHSEEWDAWTGKDGTDLHQQAFAEFIEDHLADVFDPRKAGDGAKAIASTLGVEFVQPSKVLEVSRGLSIAVNRRVADHRNLANGTAEIQFVEEHTTTKGAPLAVPGAFLIAIPVFKAGEIYQVPVRLRYRVREGTITWRFELYRTDKVFADAFGEAAKRAQSETDLPLFFGMPEV